jgi:hypothetical protein
VSTQRSRGATVRGRPLSSTCRARVYPRSRAIYTTGLSCSALPRELPRDAGAQRSRGLTCRTVPVRPSRKREESLRSHFGSGTWRCFANLVKRSWLTSSLLIGSSGKPSTPPFGHPCKAPINLRRVALFLLASALLGGGAYLLSSRVECQLGFTPEGCDPIPVRMLAMVAFMIFLGAYVLWRSFIQQGTLA